MEVDNIPATDSCVSIRARVRKSKRAIDPEFDSCQETLISFVDQQQRSLSSTATTKTAAKNGPSLLLTPVPTVVPQHGRSLSRGNMAPSKRRNRSFGGPHPRKQSTASLCSSEMNSDCYQSGVSSASDCDTAMVDVSLEDEKPEGDADAKSGPNTCQHSIALLNNKPGLPPQPMSSSQLLNHNHQRYSSPLGVHRTSSGVSANGGGSIISSARSQSSRSARSRSRSRSARRMGPRMRSMGAASAFATGNEEDMDTSSHGKSVEPISIPLKDILSVDEEVPGGNGGSNAGCGASDFYSSAASDVGAAKEAAKEPTAAPSQLSSPTPPPSSTKKVSHRIFLHTLSHGYVEFSLDNANSHDIFMAYLKAHLEPDRIPKRDNGGTSAKQVGGALLRTMVLTPTKEVPSILGSSTHTCATAKHANTNACHPSAPSPARSPPPHPSRYLPQPNLIRSNSTVSNRIDKLHSKAIHQRLQNESTPLQQMKESIEGWMSSMMDCACCQDTTVAPLEVSRTTSSSMEGTPNKGQRRSPKSEVLRRRGVGGLSFEESCGGASPKLSFERSVGGESRR